MSDESNRHSSGSTGGSSAPQSSGGYGGGRPSSGPGGRPSGPGGRPSGPGGRPGGGRPGGGGSRFGGGGGDRRGGGGGGRRRFPRRKISRFTIENTAFIDYRNYRVLKEFLTERGKIIPRRISGNSARHQRMLTRAIKRARFMALLPFTSRD